MASGTINIRQRAAADAAERSLADSGVAAMHARPSLGSTALPVRVCVSSAEENPRRARRDGPWNQPPGPSSNRAVFHVLVAGLDLDPVLGVTDLKSGDTLLVPGSSVNRPGEVTVLVQVGARVRCVEGIYWTAECHT